jgi:hypothetical protein
MSLDFTVIHWPGITNEYADAMSRLPMERNYNLLDIANPTPQSNIEISNTDLARESEINNIVYFRKQPL